MAKYIIISLDGNIGAGKTTLLNEIKNSISNIVFVDEPVGLWTSMKNDDGKNLLESFYENKNRWAYTFQNCAILTRLINIKKAIESLPKDNNTHIILTERSVLTDKYVFAEMLKESGNINEMEWGLYNLWFDTFGQECQTNAIIYLSTSAETSKNRIKIRNRQGEDDISIDYLISLDNQHKKWISNTNLPVLTLSTENDVQLSENIEKIKNFISMLN
jgi:deoxyguanosine kinase